MIETAAARALAEQLRQVEDRLGRLLISGWRQARAEAAELRHEADQLAEAGLPELAARVRVVAEASDPAEVLKAIALATSACRLLRVRLPAAPQGWTPLTPASKARRARTEALVPISRLLLDGREVWVCARPNRNEMLLVEPPFPEAEPAEPAAAVAEATGVFGRLRRQIAQALAGETNAPSHWLNRRLAGTLRWQAQYPLGVQGDVGYWTLEDPSWVTGQDEQNGLRVIQEVLSTGRQQDGALLFWNSGGFRIRELDRLDPASYVWLDPSTAEAFGQAPSAKLWAIVWMEGTAVVPVALLTLGGLVSPPRLTHLIPGTPEDVLVRPTG